MQFALIVVWLFADAGLHQLPSGEQPTIRIESPSDFQVFQRQRRGDGPVMVRGTVTMASGALSCRFVASGEANQPANVVKDWQPIPINASNGQFASDIVVPAGGWYRLELRLEKDSKTIAESSVEHLGVGEVFVVAGQSNSTNYGSEKQRTTTRMVSSFDGTRWAIANDPQPGVQDGSKGGSFLPAFGDAMYERYRVPIGVSSTGAGATSVRQWLPRGERMKNQPTIAAHVRPVGPGEWEATGTLFDGLVKRIKALGPRGCRAVLWHQGESDAGQARAGYPADRQITGEQYRVFMERLIRASRKDAGWDIPWIVAQTTYHSEKDPADEEFRAAQKALWDGKLTFAGPDTDTLRNDYRAGVHFNGKGLQKHGQMWAEKVAAMIEAIETAQSQVDLGGVVEKHVMIPMRDGVKLSAYLYFPSGKGPWPVLYEQRYADLRGAETRKSYARLAAAGYVVAAENFRGTHLSEGTWVGYRALGWGEKQDGFDTVEWLASQSWSTGKIGTLGSSQAGFAQNFLAVTQPPHLVCQYMIDTGLSLFHEGYRIGGTTRPERFKQLGNVCRNKDDNRRLLEEWFAHPTYDAYWADEDCSRHFDKMNVPCFTVGSWYDFMCVGSIDSYVGRQHRGGPNSRGKQQLILGPWLHGRNKEVNKVGDLTYPENARFAMEAHMIRWFDHYLKGIDNKVEQGATVRYYTMGAVGEKDAPGNVWRTAADWPLASKETAYYLHAGGTLSTQKPIEETGETTFLADPIHPNEIPGGAFPGAKDARSFEKQAEVRTFTSDVLAEPTEWTGKVRAELFVTSSTPDTDVIVRVSDVYPDGRSILLMDYVRRARYRDGYDKEVMLEPAKVSKIAFDIGSTSQIFNRGHRIRVTVASTGAPFYEPNPNTGLPLTIEPAAKTQVARNTVQHNREYSSRIIAPVRAVGTALKSQD